MIMMAQFNVAYMQPGINELIHETFVNFISNGWLLR